MTKQSILVLCTGNSARSQMAEGLIRDQHGDRFIVHSAGTRPSIVRPEAIRVMSEIGIDISDHRSKSVDEFTDRPIDIVLTVCDNARETCPYFPGAAKIIHRSFEDPAEATGDEDVRLEAFRHARDQILDFTQNEFVRLIIEDGRNADG
ncbi:arsenate reductase ArsC [Leptolyngbya sp. 7M]|uniref:arsenate reductase ArsC n=1 Tax=Leptolyngbya sp. 7M TaxID=2812896 RepID=UPI001B8D28B5|nr:arsenate reductase ArsC [Leptolyngbya sp. 7M]QYO65558.1 arsenate reductase ArsC [Leptolyngbya sp. 7M]